MHDYFFVSVRVLAAWLLLSLPWGLGHWQLRKGSNGLESSKVSGGADSQTSQDISGGRSRGQLLVLVEDCVWTCDA